MNLNKRIIKTYILYALFIMICLLFSGCFSAFMGDETTVIVTLGRNTASRNVIDPTLIPLLEHTVRIHNGPGQNQVKTGVKEGDTVSFNVSPGQWDISIYGLFDGAIYTYGQDKEFNVRAGQHNISEVYMSLNIADGSEGNPFLIWSETDLRMVGGGTTNPAPYEDWDLDKHYRMVDDVVLTSLAWTPIGSANVPASIYDLFTGSFNGNGHTITGLTINAITSVVSQGMFGAIDQDAVVRNLNLVNVNITGNTYIGGLVGVNNGSVINSSVTGTISSSSTSIAVGGVVGLNFDDGRVQNSYFIGSSVSGDDSIGGVAGMNTGTVVNSYSTGNISGYVNVGGVVGANSGNVINSYFIGTSVNGTGNNIGGVVGRNVTDGIVQNSYSTSPVSSIGTNIGGVVGYNFNGTVQNSYSIGNVEGTGTGSNNIGGVVGENDGTDAIVQNSYSTGSVSGVFGVGGVVGFNQGRIVEKSFSIGNISGQTAVGGVVGSNASTVQNCYSTGNVNGISNIGGVVGSNNFSGIIRYCYSISHVSGNNFVGGVEGVNSAGGAFVSSLAHNCIALNPIITRDTVTSNTFGRVAGNNTGDLVNNHARSDMVYMGSPGFPDYSFPSHDNTQNGKDGADVTVNNTVQLSTVFTSWDPTVWNIPSGNLAENGPLPTLRGVGGSQNPTLPVIP